MVRAPTSTMTMEITMATMGRLIKNFDMGLLSLSFRGKRLRIYRHAGTYFLHALGNHAFASFQSFLYHPLAAETVPDFDRPDGHLVLVVDHGYLIPTLELRDCPLRHKQRILLQPDHRADF